MRIHRLRHKAENYFRRFKNWRRIATTCGKLARNFLAVDRMIGALHWIKS